jgi:hypothetical protein
MGLAPRRLSNLRLFLVPYQGNLKERENKKVLVVSADVYRPAAIKQLAVLAQQVGVDFFPSNINEKPVSIVAKAWNGSSASTFSPTPKNLIGLPVIWRTESAAPPRASPSVLVKIIPVNGKASAKTLAVCAAS